MSTLSHVSTDPAVASVEFSPSWGDGPVPRIAAVVSTYRRPEFLPGLIEALTGHKDSVSVPPSLIGTGDHYALEVAGDSMIEAGIMDGDTVLIQKCTVAENGAIVVALVDQNEVTLKRLRKRGDSIALEPANAAHKIQLYGADRVKVQGRLVGLIRKY